MTKTHSNGLADAGKKTARWLRERLKSNAPAPTTLDIMTRVRAQFPSPQFDASDQIGIGRAALAIVKRDDPEAWEKYISQVPDIQDRPAAQEECDHPEPERVINGNMVTCGVCGAGAVTGRMNA